MGRSTNQPKAPVSAGTTSDLVDLSVVIVNYNVRDFLEQSLRSVLRAGADLDLEVFVVDNNSVDGSPGLVRSQFPGVRLIANADNVGFGTANNQAIRQARGRYILILNPDTLVQEDTFTEMIRFMDDHPDAGAVGCKILHPDGSFALESRRAFPTPSVAFYRMTGLASAFPRSPTFGRYNMTYLPEDEIAEVDALSGSCMLVRREAVFGNGERAGAGLFDEDFFMYGEDLDWCYRIQQAGWKIYYTPSTQIIHYKGESTKQGELRYVRLFYGAMLRFTEKHFEGRYSSLFELVLRAAIMARAALSVLAKTAHALTWPLIDLSTVYVAAVLAASVHASILSADVAPLFFVAVAPAYALGSVIGIGLAGGYTQRHPIRSAWGGVFIGLLVVASVSFFVKDIAFSRAVILLTYPLAGLMASAARLVWTRRERRPSYARLAVLVGRREEALRLRSMLSRHPQPPLRLEGYVWSDGHDNASVQNGSPDPTRLGRLDQLRDIVRLRNVEEVVFAAASLSNQAIFRGIQQLRDLSVHVRILAAGRDHVIGKASVDDLSMVDLLDVDQALAPVRSQAARRLFDITVALIGLSVHPFAALAARISGPSGFTARLARRTRRLPSVITGKRSVVGYDADEGYRPPPEWNLRPGVFAVTDAVDVDALEQDAAATTYWYYVRNQSASLDWDIVMRSIQRFGRS